MKICVEKLLPRTVQQTDKDFAAFLTARIWPLGSVLTISFMNNPDEGNVFGITKAPREAVKIDPLQKVFEKDDKNGVLDIKSAVKQIILERYTQLIPLLTLKFVNDKDVSAKIRIKFDQSQGCWSKVGTAALEVPEDQQTLNFGWFDVGTVLHEFGHVIGLIHEHQNPKGNTIKWNVEKLDDYMAEANQWTPEEVQRQIIDRYKLSQINGSAYDPTSIMLYFYPPELTLNSKGTSQNMVLSDVDKKTILSVYGRDTNLYDNVGGVVAKTKSNGWLILIVVILLIFVAFRFLKMT